MSEPTCLWPECDATKLIARGLCERDYRRAQRAGRLSEFKAPDRECMVCGTMFEVTKHRKTCCSPACTKGRSATVLKRQRLAGLPDRECEFCLEPVPMSARRDARFCSVSCQQARWYVDHAVELRARTAEWNRVNDGRRRAYRHARRARMYAVAYETFDAWEIAERDGWVCHICSLPVDRALGYPDPGSKSIDHVLPLIKGGSHTRANVAISHLLCNIKKKDRVSFEGVTSPSAVAS